MRYMCFPTLGFRGTAKELKNSSRTLFTHLNIFIADRVYCKYLLGRLKMSYVLAFPRTTLCARSRLQRFEQQKCYGIAEMTRDALIQRDASC